MKNIMLVEAEIWTVARTDKGNAVLVKPIGSDRAVPIFIGQLEAQSILIGLGAVPMPRPLTHDLMITMIEKLGLAVERVEVNDLKDATFYARIISKQGMKKFVFDARPSDALSIATRLKCPVYIAEFIVDESSIPISMISDADQMAQATNASILEELNQALSQAVQDENYEEAATIRDRIREIEEQSDDSPAGEFDPMVEFNVFDESTSELDTDDDGDDDEEQGGNSFDIDPD